MSRLGVAIESISGGTAGEDASPHNAAEFMPSDLEAVRYLLLAQRERRRRLRRALTTLQLREWMGGAVLARAERGFDPAELAAVAVAVPFSGARR